MRFTETIFPGAWLIEPEPHHDVRGFFMRTWCRQEFASRGCSDHFVQSSVSFNHRRGTLRGMHFQVEPHGEAKLVRCTRGAIYDVLCDVRADSETCGKWQAFELTAANRHSLYIPQGFAHGFQTLEDDSEVLYQIDAQFVPQAARGFHHADPGIGIMWPLPVVVISPNDASLGPMAPAGGWADPLCNARRLPLC